jgi:Pyridoxamine 5'-phosphate oxidase
MAKVHDGIDDRLREFLLAQPVFFVATAPSGPGGHVNLSPKGGAGCFAVLGERRVAYLDYTGSGAETIAHLRDNGRIVVMFCAFAGPPKIVRLHGHGSFVLSSDPRFQEMLSAFPVDPGPGARSIIEIEVARVSDSCGFQVPLMTHTGDRTLLADWAERKSADELAEYRATRNAASIDGLAALSGWIGSDP